MADLPYGFTVRVPGSCYAFDVRRAGRTGDLARLVDARAAAGSWNPSPELPAGGEQRHAPQQGEGHREPPDPAQGDDRPATSSPSAPRAQQDHDQWNNGARQIMQGLEDLSPR
ncbi:hypothetical protein [Nonomuraea salmonea]|uniref:hypothetical protein n=1 Tax=Nonomuraea salmonea TaxID=46181 RepID=UPI0031E8DAB2